MNTTAPAPLPHTRVDLPGTPPEPPVARLEPLTYHRLAKLTVAGGRWWRPLAVTGLAVALYLAMIIPIAIALIVLALLVPGMPQPSNAFEQARNPADLFVMLGSIALMIPAVLLALRLVGGRGGQRGTIHSVAGGLRWGLLARAGAATLAFYAVGVGGSYALFGDQPLRLPTLTPAIVACFAIVVLLTPLQAAAEEYVFRGLLPQAFGTWLRSPVWGIVLPSIAFVALHGYDRVGLIDVAVFSVCAGFLAWKTGGLELPIVLHAANNIIYLLIAVAVDATLAQGAVPVSALALSIPPTLIVTAAATVWVSRREGVRLLQPVTAV